MEERQSIQKTTDVLIHKGFTRNSQFFKVSNVVGLVSGYGNGYLEEHPVQVSG